MLCIRENKDRYGDTIKVSVTEAKKDYSLRKSGASVKYEEVWDDFDLEVKRETLSRKTVKVENQ